MAKAAIPDKKPNKESGRPVIAYCTQCEGEIYDAIYHLMLEREVDGRKMEAGGQFCSHECASAYREDPTWRLQ